MMSNSGEAISDMVKIENEVKTEAVDNNNPQNLTLDQKYESMVAKIQKRKQLMCTWPMQKKLLKLATYVKCQVQKPNYKNFYENTEILSIKLLYFLDDMYVGREL